MQRKLTKQEIGKLKQARNGIAGGVIWVRTDEGFDYWNEVIRLLDAKIKHGTSDGNPYVDSEPPIPEGWRKANADEWQRKDVQFWHTTEKSWMKRPCMGDPFDPPKCNTHYIVPIDPPLTDRDACVWPRLLVMVRDADGDDWQGPLFLLSVNDSSWPFGVACKYKIWGGGWKQARRATPAEIEAANGNS
jgi:hypothetical protein